ncbi:unnamed protein product [Mycena citricolor]|uniref:Uncharacterized protein n=1 Tax=Mycena citricolor TaxID=2018698 RepID=A0AAD2JXJ3_9AGAR|nr:unnamed protein product [Mycena citricolor]
MRRRPFSEWNPLWHSRNGSWANIFWLGPTQELLECSVILKDPTNSISSINPMIPVSVVPEAPAQCLTVAVNRAQSKHGIVGLLDLCRASDGGPKASNVVCYHRMHQECSQQQLQFRPGPQLLS